MTTGKLEALYAKRDIKPGEHLEGSYCVPLGSIQKMVTRLIVELDGLNVGLFRGEDGKLVVEIDSTGVGIGDQFENGCPDIRLWINEQKVEINEQGHLVVDGKDTGL